MKYHDLKNKIDSQIQRNDILWKQTHIMFIPSSHKYLKDDGKEKLVQYGINEVYNDFVFKENKILFFLEKYLSTFKKILECDFLPFEKNNIFFPSNNLFDEMVYYFDSVIASFAVIIEPQQKEVLIKYLNNSVKDFYPSKKVFGLWWQIYMLRNRILHYTEPRYDIEKKSCSRYMDFSSKVLMIRIENNNIKIESTLIDIYKDSNIKKAIDNAINNKDIKVFDLLFPNKSATGYGKKNPNILYISNDIYFDYALSGIKLIDEILELLDKVNHEFVKEFAEGYDDINELLNSKTSLTIENEAYSIKDVFKSLT